MQKVCINIELTPSIHLKKKTCFLPSSVTFRTNILIYNHIAVMASSDGKVMVKLPGILPSLRIAALPAPVSFGH